MLSAPCIVPERVVPCRPVQDQAIAARPSSHATKITRFFMRRRSLAVGSARVNGIVEGLFDGFHDLHGGIAAPCMKSLRSVAWRPPACDICRLIRRVTHRAPRVG